MSRLDSSRIDYPFIAGAFDDWPAVSAAARGLFLDAFLHIRMPGLVDGTPHNTAVSPVDLRSYHAAVPPDPWPVSPAVTRDLWLLPPPAPGGRYVYFDATWGEGAQHMHRLLTFLLPATGAAPGVRRIERVVSRSPDTFDPLCSLVINADYADAFMAAYDHMPSGLTRKRIEPARVVWQAERLLFRLFNEERRHDPADRVSLAVHEIWNGYQLKLEDGWNCAIEYEPTTGTITFNAGIGKGRGPAPYYPWDDGYVPPDANDGIATVNGEGRNGTVKIIGAGGTAITPAGGNTLAVTLPAADPAALGVCDCGEVYYE